MSDEEGAVVAAAAGTPPPLPEGLSAEALAYATQWNEMLAAYSKAGASGSMPFPAGAFAMPFGQPFMYPSPMMFGGMPGLHPAFAALAGAGGEGGTEEKAANGEEGGTTEDEATDEEAEGGGSEAGDDSPETKEVAAAEGRPQRRKRGGLPRAASAPNVKKVKAEGVVKSNSSAALAMLAGAAAGAKPPAVAAAEAAAAATAAGASPGTAAAAAAAAAEAATQQQQAAAAAAAAAAQALPDLWGTLNGQQLASAGSLDLSKMTAEQAQALVGGSQGVGDEREVKKMRRKQSNRESARRSRLRKQAECEQLAKQVKEFATENARLKEEKMQLVAQIEILNAKLSMSSAFGAVHAIGQGELDKIQAELRAKQTQDMAMVAAMAQATAMANGAMAAALPVVAEPAAGAAAGQPASEDGGEEEEEEDEEGDKE